MVGRQRTRSKRKAKYPFFARAGCAWNRAATPRATAMLHVDTIACLKATPAPPTWRRSGSTSTVWRMSESTASLRRRPSAGRRPRTPARSRGGSTRLRPAGRACPPPRSPATSPWPPWSASSVTATCSAAPVALKRPLTPRSAAQQIGALGLIIRAAYRQQRRQRGAQGRRAPSYNATMTRLRDALLKAAVHGPLPPVEQLILRVMPAANDRVPLGHSVD
jgi:hypothetical protein